MIKVEIKQGLSETDHSLFMNRFKECIELMDIFRLEDLLHDDIVINDQSKWEFLTEMKNRFNYLKSLEEIN